jgi:hypothetical protein
MNKLGNQYTSGLYLITHHNHDDNYYIKSEMDSKFFSDSNRVGSDADKVDGSHLSDLIGGALLQYSIIAWESPTIPPGYALCNGQISNGVTTIDMRDYFVPTAGSSYALNQTFGSNLFTISQASISIANHTITLLEMPNHAHGYTDIYVNISGNSAGIYTKNTSSDDSDLATANSGSTGGDQGHNHTTGSSVTISGSQINGDNRPSFYALYFIEKVI